MSVARAFTTRRLKQPDTSPTMPHRSNTAKQYAYGEINRSKISAPLELISTTNMLSYNAPDIYPKAPSQRSSSESESVKRPRTSSSSKDSVNSRGYVSTAPTSPDSASISSILNSPEPNHLSCYFTPSHTSPSHQTTSSMATYKSKDSIASRNISNSISQPISPPIMEETSAPIVPQRALSHTKKTHEIIHRKRSIQRLSGKANFTAPTRSPPTSISLARSSAQMFAEPAEPSHPFGAELAQVSELAEEFSNMKNVSPLPTPLPVVDEEEQYLEAKSLTKFSAQDYRNEIQGLWSVAFGEREVKPIGAMWI